VTKPIVKTERTDYISPKNALFPIDYPLADLWDLSFPLFASNLPAKIHVEPWFKILNSWSGLQGKPLESFDNTNTFHKLCKTLTELGTLENLEATLQTANAVEAIAWLNRFYQLILSQGKKLLFESYAVIPNQNRLFKKKTPALFLDEQIDEAIKDISKAIGDDWRDRLVLATVSLDNSLLAHKTQEEVLSSTILTLKQQAAKTHQDSTLRKPVIDLLVWLVQQQRTDLIADIPAVSMKAESDSPIPFSKFSVTDRLLVPPELWQNVPSDFAQLFPPDFVLASDYTERLTATHWEILTSSNFIYADPIYYEMTRLDTQSLPLGETEQKEHRLREIECSRIVFLDHPKDKSVYDRIRSSKPRSILFFKFLLFCALDKDSNWLTVLPVSCDCGVSIRYFLPIGCTMSKATVGFA
jgi:hypothetical protein